MSVFSVFYDVFTVEDEMPNCIRCDHVCDDFDCEKSCGPEHGWWGYRRSYRRESV